jgi:hypothetical protein
MAIVNFPQKQMRGPSQQRSICDIGKQASVFTQRHCPGPQKRAPASSSGCVLMHAGAPPPSGAHTGWLSQQDAAVAIGKQASLFAQ